MPDTNTPIQELKNKIRKFTADRDWEQFHAPKNLSISIAIEAAELMEKFQWIEVAESKDELERKKPEIEEEIADIGIYLLNFCSLYEIDFSEAIERKLRVNEEKYPIEKAKGQALKYKEL